ncbi:hypothetical protein E2562_004477 [Oryza meyeriana var. granulata]|uniref:Uncharacterized protein n=1 Tax=Oryza meyeriana var. granulata TaxID=110450 RepID=A0A6G1F344_9ORYZ|nr:hypothetical protein E2562_004477 [Oryza meyeriana var. granulata]
MAAAEETWWRRWPRRPKGVAFVKLPGLAAGWSEGVGKSTRNQELAPSIAAEIAMDNSSKLAQMRF